MNKQLNINQNNYSGILRKAVAVLSLEDSYLLYNLVVFSNSFLGLSLISLENHST
jgi:hypothetical protein